CSSDLAAQADAHFTERAVCERVGARQDFNVGLPVEVGVDGELAAHDADPVGGEVGDRVDVIERVAQRHVLQRYVTVIADREGEVDVEAAVVQGGYVRCFGYADER